MINWQKIENNTVKFIKEAERFNGDEKQEASDFMSNFMKIFEIFDLKKEYPVKINNEDHYIDGLLKGKLLIEMKSKGKNIKEAYEQAMGYVYNLKEEEKPILVMCCDFDKVLLYNYKKNQHYKEFRIKNLKKHIRYFSYLLGSEEEFDDNLLELNIKATKLMSELHDILKENGYDGHNLEIFLVRILFCMFADDTGIFEYKLFERYIKTSKEDGSDLSGMIDVLFSILNTPEDKRMKLIQSNLSKFRYINGNLFKEKLEPVFFNEKTRNIILECCKFDWSEISPAIFGSMFQGVMDSEKRRDLGAHYTSEENILKVIKPLFLDSLYEEFEKSKRTKKELKLFHEKISRLKFLDPACGSGNFLILTYQKIREIEFEILKLLNEDSQLTLFDISSKVHINQFYGIEYESFASEIAKISMLLMKHLMDQKVSNFLGFNIIDFPIRKNANILNSNALRVDWPLVDYIMGNPPFVGKQNQNLEQKKDMDIVFDKLKSKRILDYVSCWYKKSSIFMKNNKNVKTAFLTTTSICQGEQAPILWKNLIEEENIKIDFAYRKFKWSNEDKNNALVYCNIIGFSNISNYSEKYLFNENIKKKVDKINIYLFEGENIFLENRKNPIENVPNMIFGSMPNDGGYLILSKLEKDNLIKQDKKMEKYIKRFIGSKEFIENTERYCIWLEDKDLNNMSINIIKRIEKVKEIREKSNRLETKKLANRPYLFGEIRQPNVDYLLIPSTTTSKREYIPIGFVNKDIIASNSVLIIPSNDLSIFSILTSKTHMIFMKNICGRLGDAYRYSVSLVYNNFPFPKINEKVRKNLEKTAKHIIHIREKYNNFSYSKLYNPILMPQDLRKAHRDNDRAVWEAYGKKWEFGNEEQCLNYLLKLYKKIVENKN